VLQKKHDEEAKAMNETMSRQMADIMEKKRVEYENEIQAAYIVSELVAKQKRTAKKRQAMLQKAHLEIVKAENEREFARLSAELQAETSQHHDKLLSRLQKRKINKYDETVHSSNEAVNHTGNQLQNTKNEGDSSISSSTGNMQAQLEQLRSEHLKSEEEIAKNAFEAAIEAIAAEAAHDAFVTYSLAPAAPIEDIEQKESNSLHSLDDFLRTLVRFEDADFTADQIRAMEAFCKLMQKKWTESHPSTIRRTSKIIASR